MQQKEPLVWIVVPVFEREFQILKLVTQLHGQTYDNYKLIVVDHGKKKINRTLGPKVEIITASPHLWWTGAVNLGIRYVLRNENINPNTPILIMNDDVEFDKCYLSTLVSDWGGKENCIMGSICADSESSKILYADIVLNKLRAEFEFNHKYETIHEVGTEVLNSDILPGRGTLIPIKILSDIGIYDEIHLPHYRADYELVYRAKKKGYEVYMSPNAVVYSVLDSPHKLEKNNKLKSIYLLLFGRKSVRNIKDLFYFSYLNFNLFYGTYYLSINLLRGLCLTLKEMEF